MTSRNLNDVFKYKSYRNKLSKLIKTSKENYYNKYFTNNNRNVKAIWKGIKELITLKPSSIGAPTKLIAGNSCISDSLGIANTLNDYFSSVGCELADQIPSVTDSPLD